MHFQRIGRRLVVPVVDIVVENFAMYRASGFLHQAREQGKLFWRQLQRLFVQPDLTTRGINTGRLHFS